MKGHSVTSVGFQWNISGTIVRQLSAGKDAEISEASLLLFQQNHFLFCKTFLMIVSKVTMKVSKKKEFRLFLKRFSDVNEGGMTK